MKVKKNIGFFLLKFALDERGQRNRKKCIMSAQTVYRKKGYLYSKYLAKQLLQSGSYVFGYIEFRQENCLGTERNLKTRQIIVLGVIANFILKTVIVHHI